MVAILLRNVMLLEIYIRNYVCYRFSCSCVCRRLLDVEVVSSKDVGYCSQHSSVKTQLSPRGLICQELFLGWDLIEVGLIEERAYLNLHVRSTTW